MLGIDNAAGEFIVAECKYQEKKVGGDVLENLKEKTATINWHKPFKLRKLILFSKTGFTDELINISKQDERVELIIPGKNN